MSSSETREIVQMKTLPGRFFPNQTHDDAFRINHDLETRVMKSNFLLCANRKISNKWKNVFKEKRKWMYLFGRAGPPE